MFFSLFVCASDDQIEFLARTHFLSPRNQQNRALVICGRLSLKLRIFSRLLEKGFWCHVYCKEGKDLFEL